MGADPPPTRGSLAPDEGMVQGCVRPRAAAHSGYPRADNGGALTCIAKYHPGREHLHIRLAVPSGRIGTYGGQYKGGSEAALKK